MAFGWSIPPPAPARLARYYKRHEVCAKKERSIGGNRAMPIAIREIGPGFVGEVSDIDLTKPASREEVAAIETGMDRYAVLVFRGQRLTDDEQMTFSRNFGALERAVGSNVT